MSQKGWIHLFLPVLASSVFIIIGLWIILFNYLKGYVPFAENPQTSGISLPEDLKGDYFYVETGNIQTDQRLYPVYDLYQLSPDNQLKKITQLGSAGHYINQIILSPKHKKLIVSDEDRLYTLDLTSGKKEMINLDYKDNIETISISPDQNHLAVGIFSPGYNVTIYNLVDHSTKVITEEEIEKLGNVPYVMPVFWTSNEEVFLIPAVEGGGNYLRLNIKDNSVVDTGIRFGLPSPDKSKIFNSDKLPQYGGCYVPRYFNLYLQDVVTGEKQVITGGQNAEFTEIAWKPDSQAVLYSKQIYTPTSKDLCPSAERSDEEYFTFDLTTKKIEKIDSEAAQYAEWYPKDQLFKDMVNKGKDKFFDSLGSIK